MQHINRVINGIGTVAPLQSVDVRPRIDGQVMEIPFAEGEMVELGSVLLKLDDRELVALPASTRTAPRCLRFTSQFSG
jgi:multidrug efflux system membrane fusion protein